MSAQPVNGTRDGDAVRFILDGEVIEVRDAAPADTLLPYLRDTLGRKGTKEGCAEGDCGACTVVLVEPEEQGSGLRLRAVNACIQFLPTLDGKELVTVESLRDADGGLHPVQQAMVDCHGSQCGFCTPGFVMSLFALYKTNAAPTRRDIDDALAGNLCRCTGYKPIVEAALAMHGLARARGEASSWLAAACGEESACAADREARARALHAIRRPGTLRVTSGPGVFYAPRRLGELADIVLRHPQATLLAGGTDVGLWVTKALRELDTLVYTGEVAELKRVGVAGGHLEIGAAATLAEAMPALLGHYPELGELLRRFASPPIRNAATLGGNVANGSPVGDSMPALLVLDAELVLRRGDARRELPLAEFYLGYRKTALAPGEFLECIRVPLPAKGMLFGSYKVSKRFDQDIAAVCGAWRLQLDGRRIEPARVAYGGMAAVPARAARCEEALAGSEWNEATVRRAMTALSVDFTPISDMRASAGYRRRVAANLLYRFWLATNGPDGQRVYEYGREKLA